MPQNPAAGLQKWEYVSVTRNSDAYLVKDINELGGQGWELVNVYYYKSMKGPMVWTAFMKRLAGIGPPPPAALTDHAVAPTSAAEPQPVEEKGVDLEGFDLEGDEFKLEE